MARTERAPPGRLHRQRERFNALSPHAVGVTPCAPHVSRSLSRGAVCGLSRHSRLHSTMPLSKARAKVVEGLLSNNGSADDPEIAEDIKLVEREVADELGSAHPIVQDKAALRRFVVARKLCNAEVITMIEEHMKWRAASVPVPITEALVAELKKGKIELFGQDTQGRQVVMIRSGKFDPKERDLDTAVASVVYMIEKALAAQPNSQFTVFYDRTNFSLRKHWDFEFIKAVGETLRTHRAAQCPRRRVSWPKARPPAPRRRRVLTPDSHALVAQPESFRTIIPSGWLALTYTRHRGFLICCGTSSSSSSSRERAPRCNSSRATRSSSRSSPRSSCRSPLAAPPPTSSTRASMTR